MIEALAKIVLVEGVNTSLKTLTNRLVSDLFGKTDKTAIIEAITSIQKAIIKTRNFIADNGYIRNEGLTDLWHDALNKVVAANIDDNLPEYLYQKARFWGEPKDWLRNPETLELIPKLNALDEKCEMLLKQITTVSLKETE